MESKVSEQKTPDLLGKSIEQYAEEYQQIINEVSGHQAPYHVEAFLAGAAKQKELDLEIIKKLEAKLRNMVKAPEPEICGDTY